MKAIKNTYVKDRDKALLSLDEQQIRAFCKNTKCKFRITLSYSGQESTKLSWP